MFKQEYKIGYRGLGADLRSRTAIIIELMQETGTRHTDNTDHPMSWHAENKLGFIITNSVLMIRRAPSLGELVTVTTSPVSAKGMFAERFYSMTDADGKEIAVSFTKWVLLDLESRKPIRIPGEIMAGYGGFYTEYNGTRDLVIPDRPSDVIINEDAFKAARRDTDSNTHVNNIAYVAWAEEYVPDDVYYGKRAVLVKVKYKKECKAGDLVKAVTKYDGGSSFLTVFKDAEGGSHCEVYSRWE